MAKTRAQRKAERRKREAQAGQGEGSARRDEARAQRATQIPESGDVAEVEAILETGASAEELGEHVRPSHGDGDGESAAALKSPAPSRADVGAPEEELVEEVEDLEPAEPREGRRERKRREREEQREKEARRRAREKKPAEPEERRRGAVIGFIVSCWAELKRVQWPDRETLIQATAVTIIFIAVAAAYLGVLDAIFSWLIQRII